MRNNLYMGIAKKDSSVLYGGLEKHLAVWSAGLSLVMHMMK